VGRVLGDVDRGAAVLAAEGEALCQAQEDEDQGRGEPDAGERREQPHERRRQAHHHDRDQERVLAARKVAQPPEEQGAEGAHREADAEEGET